MRLRLICSSHWNGKTWRHTNHSMKLYTNADFFCIDLKGVLDLTTSNKYLQKVGMQLDVMPEIQTHNFYGHFDRRVAMGAGTSEGDGTGKFLWCHQFQQPLGDRFKIFHSWFCQCRNLLPFCLSKHRRLSQIKLFGKEIWKSTFEVKVASLSHYLRVFITILWAASFGFRIRYLRCYQRHLEESARGEREFGQLKRHKFVWDFHHKVMTFQGCESRLVKYESYPSPRSTFHGAK